MDRLLISGIASPLGERLAAAASSRMEVCGIDRVAARTLVDGRPLRAFVLDPRTRRLDDVLGQERPDAIVHFPGTGGTPLDGRVLGDTLRVLEAARDAGVPQVVVLSSALVYGANNAARPFRDEDAAVATAAGPSRFHAGVAPDVAAALFGAQHIETRVAVLRAVGTLGHRAASGLGLLLQPGLVPLTLGHDPLIQLLHSDDLVEALLAAARHGLRGVFNVSGPDPLPLSLAVQESGGSAVPLPSRALRASARLGFGWSSFDLDFLVEPCTVSGHRFVAATGFTPRWTLHDLFKETRDAIAA